MKIIQLSGKTKATLVYALLVLGLILACLLMPGCAKQPVDSSVEGFWKLERFTTKEDGAVHEPERIFYGITRYVVEFAERQGTQGYGVFIGRFGYKDEGREAVMSEFKVRAATSDSKKDATLEQLKPFGIGAMETTFRIVKADGKALVLESDYAKLELKRY